MIPPCDLSIIPDYIWGIMTLAQEARGESLDGMIGVAEAIRNRANTKFFSDGTIRGTVLKPNQFSGWNTNDPNRVTCASLTWDDPVTIQALKAWNIAINNKTELTDGAVMFHADYVSPDWSKSPEFIFTCKIGKTLFYKRRL